MAASPFISILESFAEARSRDQARTYRCPECGAATRGYAPFGDPPDSLACWAADRDIICTGHAVREPSDAA